MGRMFFWKEFAMPDPFCASFVGSAPSLEGGVSDERCRGRESVAMTAKFSPQFAPSQQTFFSFDFLDQFLRGPQPNPTSSPVGS